MLVETVAPLALLIGLAWPALKRRVTTKRVLLWTGIVAVAHHLLGTFTYNVVSPNNPLKSDWQIGEDFIALYVQQFGLAELLLNTAGHAVLLGGLFVLGGYLVSRFFLPVGRSEMAPSASLHLE